MSIRTLSLSLLLREGTTNSDAENVLVNTSNVVKVTQVFPQEADNELLRMYVVDVLTKHVTPTLEQLRAYPFVEYVEITAPRKPPAIPQRPHAKSVKKTYTITSCGRDEYPGDGLRLRTVNQELNKDFLTDMGLEVRSGDEVEITARIVSRVETIRKRIK